MRSGPGAARTWRQRGVVALNLLIVFSCLAAAGGLVLARQAYDERGVIEFLEAPGSSPILTEAMSSGEPLNFLLVGTDFGDGLDDDDPVLNGRDGLTRADTLMVMRLDPSEGTAKMLSVPRDLWVDIEGSGFKERINYALQVSESTLVATVEETLEVPIHHYVQVDFAGFVELIDVIDGVPIYFDTPARDRGTGFLIEEAGCHVLEGDQALAYARSRNFQRADEDGDWLRADPTVDFGRQARQQDLIRRAASRALTKGFRNPITMNTIITAGMRGVSVDSGLDVPTLVDLGVAFGSFDPDGFESFRLPVDDRRIRGKAVVRLIESQAEPVLSQFRPSVEDGVYTHSLIDIALVDGTGYRPHTRQVVERIKRRGFEISDRSVADATGVEEMTIEYTAESLDMAAYLARWFVDPPVMEEVSWIGEGDLRLITGRNWSGTREEIGPPLAGFAPTTTTTTTTTTSTTTTSTTTTTTPEATDGASTGSSGSNALSENPEPDPETTSSSVVGDVPVTPPGVSCG